MQNNQQRKITRIKKFLRDLVQFKSTKNDIHAKRKITRYVVNFLQINKLCSQVYENNGNYTVIASFHNDRLFKPALCLHGHLDVVPGQDNQYHLKEKNGRLYGRGVLDMKGAIAVFLTIIEDITNTGAKPDLGFLFVTDEEIGGFDGAQSQVKKGFLPQFIISGEPTNLKIGYQSKGVIWVKIKTIGKPAHAAYLYKGDNALINLMRKISYLISKYPIPKNQAWKTTINVATISTKNSTPNTVPDQAEAFLDIRNIPTDKSIFQTLEDIADKKTAIEFILKEPSAHCEKNNKNIALLKTIINKQVSIGHILVRKHGASDIRHFTGKGIPGVVFGLEGNGHHSNHEWIKISSLQKYYFIISEFIKNINL